MKFSTLLISGRLIRRYKRFLADVRLADGRTVVAHCPNTGAMYGCQEPGSVVWLSESNDPKRKTQFSWQLASDHATLVGVNTALSNHLVKEAIQRGVVAELSSEYDIQTEPRIENGRLDLLLSGKGMQSVFVEVKNVTAAVSSVGDAFFPDAVSERASKHLIEMMRLVALGYRCVMFFCVQRSDVNRVMPADHIDPKYGATLRQAIASGVEVLAYRAHVSAKEIRLVDSIPVMIPTLSSLKNKDADV